MAAMPAIIISWLVVSWVFGNGSEIQSMFDSGNPLRENFPRFLFLLILPVTAHYGLGILVTVLSVYRMRDAGRNIWLAIFSGLPVLNLLVVIVFCLLPASEKNSPRF